MKTIKFYTLGCKVNQYETQAIREYFLNKGFKEINNGIAADVYLINTCTVTHKADVEALSLIRRFRRENPKSKIIVTGCLAKLDSNKILSTDQQALIIKNKSKIMNKDISTFSGHTRAFLKIQDGCNNCCSYCKVPLVRGKSKSKLLSQVIKEAQKLVKNGFKEIVLTGICLGTYGKDFRKQMNLVSVIEALEKIEGFLRIRLSSIEAGDVTDVLIEKMKHSKKLCHHLHIPVQSGDNDILRKMNRRYTREDYLLLIKKLKKEIPDIGITTDVLVGFPGENEDNFQNTIDLIKEIMPLKVHAFPYSERAGTLAASNGEALLKPAVLHSRMKRLNSVSDDCAQAFRNNYLGKDVEVLIEARSKLNPNLWEGYTGNYLKACVISEGDLLNVLLKTSL